VSVELSWLYQSHVSTTTLIVACSCSLPAVVNNSSPTGQQSSQDLDSVPNRRRLLQMIGAAGLGTVTISGSASAKREAYPEVDNPYPEATVADLKQQAAMHPNLNRAAWLCWNPQRVTGSPGSLTECRPSRSRGYSGLLSRRITWLEELSLGTPRSSRNAGIHSTALLKFSVVDRSPSLVAQYSRRSHQFALFGSKA